MINNRQTPPVVRQSRVDSCWAAVLESWSRLEPRFPNQTEAALIERWGEGPTGGITPVTKIPAIAQAFHLTAVQRPVDAMELVPYIERHLPNSHLFCAYSVGTMMHAVLIYQFNDAGDISYMDPRRGSLCRQRSDWFMSRGPYVLMRRS